MYSVGRIPDPQYGRIGLQGGRPLAERYQETLDWALKQIPEGEPEREGLASQMISELGVDQCHIAVRQFKERTYRDDPKLRAEWQELCRLQHQYNEVVREIVELQKQFLWRCEHDWRHQCLRSTKADMFTTPRLVNVDWDEKEYPDFKSTKEAQKKAHAMLQWALDLRGLVGNAMAFNDEPPEQQALHLCHALFDELTELRHSVKNLQSVTAALQAELQRKPKRKAK